MKRIHLIGIGSWLAACAILVDCGSSDTPTIFGPAGLGGASGGPTTVGGTTSTGTTVSGASSTTTGDTMTSGTTVTSGSTGAGGVATVGVGTGPTTSTTTGSAGGGNGGSGQGGAGGATGGVDAGGPGAVDAGTCPRMPPMNGGACGDVGEVCDYPGLACACAPAGMTRDGGARDAWMCVRVRPDAGAGACPVVAPANGTMCTMAGEVCPYARETCTCQMGMGRGARERWACMPNGRDGG